MSVRHVSAVALTTVAMLAVAGCRDSAAPPAPSLDVALEEDPGAPGGVTCGEDIGNPDFGSDFSLTLNGCPASLPANPTEWEYQYRAAVAGNGTNVYATYAIYYDDFGNVSAERVAISAPYSSQVPRPLRRSGVFPLSYPAGVTGIKFRSYATIHVDCSTYSDSLACWEAAEQLGYSAGYHDEVRYCIVDTSARDFTSFCDPDGIDVYAPEIAREGWPLLDAQWSISYSECGDPSANPPIIISDCVIVTFDARSSTGLGPLTYYWESRWRSYYDCDPPWSPWPTTGPIASGGFQPFGETDIRLRVVNPLGSSDTLMTAIGGVACGIVP